MRKLMPRTVPRARSTVVADLGEFVNALHLTPTGVLVAGDQRGRVAFLPNDGIGWGDAYVRRVLAAPVLGLVPWRDQVVAHGWEGGLAVVGLTGRPRHLEGHTDRVTCAAVVGDTLVTGGHDQTLRTWDLFTGEPQWTSPQRGFWVDGVHLVGDGRAVVMVRYHALEVWDLAAGALLSTLDGAGAAAMIGRGTRLASVDGAGRVTLTDVDAGSRVVATGVGGDPVLSWSATGAVVVGGESGRVVAVDWDGTARPIGAHDQGVLGFAAWNGRLASWSLDKSVRVWDPASGLLARHDDHTNLCECAVVADRAGIPHVVTGSADGTIRAWNPAASPPDLGRPRAEHRALVSRVRFLDDDRVASAANDGFRVWSIDEGAIVDVRKPAEVNAVREVGDLLVTCTDDNTVELYEADGRHLATLGSGEVLYEGRVCGERYLTAGAAGTVAAYTFEPFAPAWSVRPHSDAVFTICPSPDGSRVATASMDGWHALLDAATGAEIGRLHAGNPVQVALWVDDDHLVGLSRHAREAQLWRVSDGEVAVLGGPDASSVAVVGGVVLIGRRDGRLEAWRGAVRVGVIASEGGVIAAIHVADGGSAAWLVRDDGVVSRVELRDGVPQAVTGSVETGFAYWATAATAGDRLVVGYETRCAVHGADGEIASWEAPGKVGTLVFDGDDLWVGCDSGDLERRDARTGALLGGWRPHTSTISSVVACRAGVVTTGFDHRVVVSGLDGEHRFASGGHGGFVFDCAAIDDDTVVSWAFDGSVIAWSIQARAAVWRHTTEPIRVGAVVDLGRTVLLGRQDGVVEVLDVARRRPVAHVDLGGKVVRVAEVAGRVAFGSTSGKVALFGRSRPDTAIRSLGVADVGGEVTALAWDTVVDRLVAAAHTGSGHAVLAVDLDGEVTQLLALGAECRTLAHVAGRLVVGLRSGRLQVWDRSGALTFATELPEAVWCIDVRGRRVVVGDTAGTVAVWEVD